MVADSVFTSIPFSSANLQQKQLIVSVLFGLGEESLQLVLCEHLHLPRFLRRQFTADSRVDPYQPFGYRFFQCHSATCVAGAHHAVGQSRCVFFHVLLSSVPLQPCVELLQIVLRQLVQRYLADVGDDVIVDSLLVVLLSQRSDGRRGVVLVPEVDPIAEGHIGLHRVLGGRYSSFSFSSFSAHSVLACARTFLVIGNPLSS